MYQYNAQPKNLQEEQSIKLAKLKNDKTFLHRRQNACYSTKEFMDYCI